MVPGKHPLDVFRSTSSGFGTASSRRTVPGKVISTSAHSPEAGPERIKPTAPEAKTEQDPSPVAPTKPRRRPEPSRARPSAQTPTEPGTKKRLAPPLRPLSGLKVRAKGLSSALFSVALLGMASAAVWVVVSTDWAGGALPLKLADAADVLEAGPGGVVPEAPAASLSTIRVAVYAGSAKGQTMAWSTRDELAARGFAVSDPVGIEAVGADGVPRLQECHLYVGQARTASDLDPVLARLRAIADWPHGDPKPFVDARIVSQP